MRKTILLIATTLLLFSFSGPKAAIEWTFTEYDFGEIELKKPAVIEFAFKNPGMIPLVISNVEPSCGCTVPEYPKQPISPGGEGKIKVTYDAKLSGYFSKSIKVSTNTVEGITTLYIKGEVK